MAIEKTEFKQKVERIKKVLPVKKDDIQEKSSVQNVSLAEANRQLFDYMKKRGVQHANQTEPSKTIPAKITPKKETP